MNRLWRFFGRLVPSSTTETIWKRGEDAAAAYMKSKGYKILARNLRLSMGEIDLVCEDPKTGAVVVVEVKARLQKIGDTKQITPEAAITSAKASKLRLLTKALANQYLNEPRPIRIDVIAVVFGEGQHKQTEFRHYESAV